MKIEGAHALVTGGGTGIGAAIAQALVAEGAAISLLGRRDAPLREIAAGMGGQAFVATCDVTQPAQVAAAFEAARERHGAIDILVNNAGAAATAPFVKLDFDAWRSAMAVNCDSVFHCTRAVIGEMAAAGRGRIVTVASVAGLQGVAYASAYSAAKHAAIGLMRSIALEMMGKGVTANAVCPGFVDTEMFARSVATIREKTGRSAVEARAELARLNPSGRVITPKEVAAMVIELIETKRTGETVEIA